MTTSESPTHPDAPRAGGETPDSRPALDLEAKCSVCSHDREMHGDDAPNLLGCGMIGCQCSAFDGRFAALPSLLERHRDGEREAERKRLWYWAYSLNIAGAQLALALANAENRENGEPNNWPAQQEWSGLGGSSHSIFLRLVREMACIHHDAFLEYVRGVHGEALAAVAETVYVAAAAPGVVRQSQFLGGCTCSGKEPTVPVYRDHMQHLDDCPAKDSGYPVGAFAPSAPPSPERAPHD